MKKQTITIHTVPIGKPRMTQRDKWFARAATAKYWAYAARVRAAAGLSGKSQTAPLRVDWVVYLPIPKSWTAKRRAEVAGQPHRQRPDRDNIDKGLLDALFADDSGVAQGVMAKFWDDGKGPRIILTLYWS